MKPTRQAALAFTHGDVFKPVPGYKTFVNHFHLRVVDRMRVRRLRHAAPGPDGDEGDRAQRHRPERLPRRQPGGERLRPACASEIRRTTARCRGACRTRTSWSCRGRSRACAFGGHYNIMWPKNVFWSKPNATGGGRAAPQAVGTALPFEESDPTYGKVYHTGNAENVQRLLDAEGGYWYHAHPRTKSTAGFPGRDRGARTYLKNDRYLGVAFKPGMGQDNSEATHVRVALLRRRRHDEQHVRRAPASSRSCVIADIDTYRKSPEDDTVRELPGELPEARHGARARRGLESGLEGACGTATSS